MLQQTATITNKMRLTIPEEIARKVGIKGGEDVHVEEKDGRIILTPMRQLIEELAGSIPVPDELKGRDLDEVIEEAKMKYFASKRL